MPPALPPEGETGKGRSNSSLRRRLIPDSCDARRSFGAPTARAALEHMPVMQKPVEHRADSGHIAQQLSPVFHRPIRRQQRAGPFVAAHHDLQQILGGGERELAHSEIVDDQQRHRGQRFHVLLALAVGHGVGEFIEQDVGFAVEHTIALLNGGLTDGLSQMTFARAAGPEKETRLRACR